MKTDTHQRTTQHEGVDTRARTLSPGLSTNFHSKLAHDYKKNETIEETREKTYRVLRKNRDEVSKEGSASSRREEKKRKR